MPMRELVTQGGHEMQIVMIIFPAFAKLLVYQPEQDGGHVST